MARYRGAGGCRLADIVCTLTASPTPILKGEWLKPGQHLNLVGSSIRAAREADDEVVARGYFIADSRAHALAQAGEFCHALEQGRVGDAHLKGEIGEVLAGAVAGRTRRNRSRSISPWATSPRTFRSPTPR